MRAKKVFSIKKAKAITLITRWCFVFVFITVTSLYQYVYRQQALFYNRVRLNRQQALSYNSALNKLDRLDDTTQKRPCLPLSNLYRTLNLLDRISCFFLVNQALKRPCLPGLIQLVSYPKLNLLDRISCFFLVNHALN